MMDQARPFSVALVTSRPEDHDLVGALLAQCHPTRFQLSLLPSTSAALEAIASGCHEAYLVDASLLPASRPDGGSDVRAGSAEDLLAQAVEAGRPAILLTDGADPERDDRLVAAGAWDCLARPALTPALLDRCLIREIAHGRQLRLDRQRGESQKLESLARLAGRVAHDFNNLLTAMLGYAEMLRESLDPGDVRREDAIEIQRAGERANALTRRLLTLGRRQPSRPGPLDLNALLDRAEPLLLLLPAKIHTTIVRGERLGRVHADAAQLEQVLASLVVNARDAMPDGGRLRIETGSVDLDEEHAIAHLGTRPGRHAMLLVADTGTGMTPEALSHLFEPFFTTKDKGKGVGLALAVARGIVQQAGGHITVESRRGRGTTVRVYLPVAEERGG